MTARVLVCLLAVPVAGVLMGSGLAALAHAPGNDPCLNLAGRTEGRSWWDGSLELWPLGLRCENSVRSEFFGPTTGELTAWIAAAVLLAMLALWRRGSAFVRGAATAGALLALAGVAWLYIGVNGAFFAAVCLGPLLAFALDRRLRPAAIRSRWASLYFAVALGAVMFCAIFGVVAIRGAGIAFGVLGGGLVSVAVERARRRSAVTT